MIACWWKAWDIFQKIVEQEEMKTSVNGIMESQDYKYPVDEWLQDMEMELGNAVESEKRLEFCRKVLEIFDWSFDDSSNYMFAIGEELYETGKVDEGRIIEIAVGMDCSGNASKICSAWDGKA